MTDDEIAELSRPIEPTGDPLLEKREGIVRFGFQNIMGLSIKEGHTVLPEAASIHALQLDFVGIVEPNRVMTHENKKRISTQLNYFAGQSKLVCSSSPSSNRDSDYSHGGAITAAVGHQTGRVMTTGADKWGRFSWMTLRATRDEGILLVTIYRVPQTKGTKTTSGTAYAKQIELMMAEGDRTCDPRT